MEETERNIWPGYIFNSIKRKRRRILLTAVISFLSLCLLGLLTLLIMPPERVFSQQIHVQLKRGKGSVLVYPDETPFNHLDIICPAVLQQVYTDQSLASVIPFDKFTSLFSVVNYSRKLAILNADFGQKLAKRNLSVADMNQLEELYLKKLNDLNNSTYQISMKPSIHLTDEKSAQILGAIPQTWMLLFRKTNGGKLPRIGTDALFAKKLREAIQTSHLIAIDRATHCNDQLLKLCDSLQELQGDRNIRLTSGESLDDLNESLHSIRKYQLDPLLQMVLNSSNLHSDMDRYFVNGQLQSLQQQLASSQMKYDSIGKSLSIIQNPARTTAAGKSADAGEQVSIDSSVFQQIESLTRRDVNNALRRELATENVSIGEEIAELQSEMQYYQQMLGVMDRSKNIQGNVEQFEQMFTRMVDSLSAAAAKVNGIRQLITEDYLSGLDFFSPAGQISLQNTYLIHPLILTAITAGIWILFNLLVLAIGFARDFYAENSDNPPQAA